MRSFDPSQSRVLDLDPTRHARVLGAAGTGKTRVLLAAFARVLGQPGWGEGDALVLAPNRLVAASLRAGVERGLGRAFGGTPVRTATSLAFALLGRAASLEGREAPRLLTGTVQDEAIAEVVAAGVAESDAGISGIPTEVLHSPAFRAELRELWRVSDDFGIAPSALVARLGELGAAAASEAFARVPDPELSARWRDGFGLIDAVAARLGAERPDELSASGLLRAAAAAVRRDGGRRGSHTTAQLPVPRLILVDDAQELGEGELALLAACADVGTAIWVFGDPDLATGAFQGERTRVLARLDDELARRSEAGPSLRDQAAAQLVVLDTAHRHGPGLRSAISGLADRVGAAELGEQRAAQPRAARPEDPDPAVQFAVVDSGAEQLGVIAHRLRARRLGLGGTAPVPWSEMAVLCRSRLEATRVARALAVHQVPTGIAAGGIVLREHQIARELVRVLQHVLGIRALSPEELLGLAGGAIGGLDPVALRRLRGALLLQERREAREEERAARETDEIVADAVAFPGATPVVDSAGGRVLRRLGLIIAAAAKVHAAGGTPRETLWAIWDGTKLASDWQADALDGRGARSDDAHRSLDAVLGLFFALQRHEEQDSAQPVAELLDELLTSAVPEDSLAQRSQRAAVTVTTPQGALGREFAIVAIVGLQDGSWPNLRARGSLLGAAALERWLRGEEAVPPSRRDTIHDELRLLVHACARASAELLVVAVSDEDQHPSALFGLGRDYRVTGLPSSRLTLRGVTAAMRRRLTNDPADPVALRALTELARAGVAGAPPDEWYGVLPPSTSAPLVDLDGDPEAAVSVSPSQLERAETCPLDWVIAHLGGSTGSVQANLGTLVHHALETAQSSDADELLAAVMSEWRKLEFDAAWEAVRAERLAGAMTRGLAAYLREFEASERTLIGTEASFAAPIDRAVLRGVADRLERRVTADGEGEVTVLDLKTGRTPPSKVQAETHAQLRAYQLGVRLGAFDTSDESAAPETRSGGARLLYVHPDATNGGAFIERVQEPIDDATIAETEERVAQIARVMAAGEFTARVEHHCSDPHQPGNCRLHIIPAVSQG
ncbi:UrvD/REP family ATP-dependent DNA helicase [Leucobacter luti]|uniref:DNA 3'-5' helicase n=1 Tax=Leucobacter luti TaxID=340320 RepID=A0A4Q7TWL0_9MICO|nr:UrvD/REP family ATP-dependent DNA helicase [Leucobacter luti]MBL3698332.1 PD-(D/E)XK nuclease family protein [Leucobacter luti]RZT64580.1 superfamily I DNA/RNA helicase [Leucobacter luti]